MNGLVVCGQVSLSLSDLRASAGQAANALIANGGSDGRVALLLRNSIDFVAANEAARLAGLVPVPINWHFNAAEVAYVLNDCGAGALIAHSDLLNAAGEELLNLVSPSLKIIWVPTPSDMQASFGISAEQAEPPAGAETWESLCAAGTGPLPAPSQPAFPVIYTSGTTGHPKGVVRKGAAATPGTPQGTDAFFTSQTRTLLSAPMYHSAPNRFAQRTLLFDGTLVLTSKFDAEETLALIERWKITTTFLVPTMMSRILRLPQAVLDRYDTSSLRHVVTAGAPCPPEIKRRLIELWGPVVYEFYGASETGALTHCTSEDALARPGTVGRCQTNARIAILDEQGQPCPTGTSGEIYGVRVDYPEFTYLNRPEERDKVVVDGLITGGDIGYLDADGYLFINDRKRDMIISGGVNIYPAHIEAAMLQHEKVLDCAVFGVPDQDRGEQVAVAYETTPDDPVTEDELRTHIAGLIAKYMVPRLYVKTDTLPRDPSGKIQKRRLRAPYWEGSDSNI
ncbi:AMP-binding protein [Pseudooceanicola sp.]|uniref:AMP-binding protein n=1 Tax=Pseudooceanicola sp. TaxID=1914328 RepID=UPI00261E1259|nr:AMP-binding protein [Pseudooceanicola sp.]MDF1856818.1 AMP-binding protein [Pseudooceanicola sp.]